MYEVELYRKIRQACHRDGMSERQAALKLSEERKYNQTRAKRTSLSM